MIKISVTDNVAYAVDLDRITSGSVGLILHMEFSEAWRELIKRACFSNGEKDVEVIISGDSCVIPSDILNSSGVNLSVGIRGMSLDGELIIPTVYADLGQIEEGARASAASTAKPTPNVVDQIQQTAQNAVDIAQSVRDDADAGRFDGKPGKPGPPGKQGPKGDSGLNPVFAVCYDETAPSSFTANKWYIPKTIPRPAAEVGLMVDVLWKQGRVGGLGYDVQLIWGEPGGADNEVIVDTASTSDKLTGSHSIPVEGTVRYQLTEYSGRLRWDYVSGELIPTQFSSETGAAVAEKLVPGMSLEYIPGMEIYVQLDRGNTAELMSLKDDNGLSLPVYGNGTGAKTGDIPAGYILHLVNAGDHWQIINSGGSGGGGVTPEELNRPVHTTMYIDIVPDGFGSNYAYYNGDKISANSILNHANADGLVIARYDVPGTTETRLYYYSQKDSSRQPVFLRSYIEDGVSKQAVITVDNNSKVTVTYKAASSGGGGGAVDSVNGKTGTVVLTAADVKARADTWTPTAAQVGARSDTWMPTAADVGALPDDTPIPNVPSWALQPNKPSYSAAEVGALPSTTKIPAKLSELTSDAGHQTVTAAQKGAWNAKSDFSGSYNDLTNKPTIPPAYTLPIAGAELGGVKGPTPTAEQTETAGIDENGNVKYKAGGAIEGKFELIEKIKFTETAKLERTKEPDGTPYAFKRVCLKAKVPAQTSATIGFVAWANGLVLGAVTLTASGLSNSTVGEWFENHGWWEVNEIETCPDYYSASPYSGTAYIRKMATPVTNPISELSSNTMCPSGCEIEIWAVRA